MPEWFNDLIIAIGGGTVVLVGALTICKNLLIKFFETGIESSFEKNLEKYRNQLSRSTKAFEILLEKEFNYYSTLDPHLATLAPLVQDLVYYADMSNEMELEYRQRQYKENMKTFLEIIPKMKNESVLFQPYIPNQVWIEVSHLIGSMQRDLSLWNQVGNVIFGEDEKNIDLQRARTICDDILLHIATVETVIKKRLTQLSTE